MNKISTLISTMGLLVCSVSAFAETHVVKLENNSSVDVKVKWAAREFSVKSKETLNFDASLTDNLLISNFPMSHLLLVKDIRAHHTPDWKYDCGNNWLIVLQKSDDTDHIMAGICVTGWSGSRKYSTVGVTLSGSEENLQGTIYNL